jgi:hypothetical protein
MKRKVVWSLLMLLVLIGASLTYTRSASSSSSNQRIAVRRALPAASNLMLPLATTFDVDRTDDTAAATACTAALNDCSLRGAIIAANADISANPVIINLQPATTYNLTLSNATQENAAATGDLDINTILHTVTIIGGGSSGPNATIIDATGLNTGSSRDRAFHLNGAGVNVSFQDLVIQNGQAADNGTSGVSTNPTAQNTSRAGGGILNNGGSLTLDHVIIQSCQALGKGDSIVNQHTTLDALGGGVASLTATGNVIITDSTLTDNDATGGTGGIFNNAAGSNAMGGSIYFEGGTLNISGSRIDTSSASGGNGGNQDQNGQTNGGFGGLAQGGGVWVGSGGTVSINNTTFESTVTHGGNSGTGGNGANPGGGADGGGLYSLGNVTVSNSTFHLTGATGGDGGDAFGTTCLGAHNAGDGGGARGGAVFADGGTMTVNTATFANNFAIGGQGGDGGQTPGPGCGMHGAGGLASGGAITNNTATLNIKHATISLNNAQAGNTGVNQSGAIKPPRLAAEGTGGGIRVGSGSVTLENTIIAGNTAANGAGDTTGAPVPGPNVDGAVISNGHNLLGVATEATGFTGTGDQTGANPMLAALADNGGPTQTMALSVSSPAIDAGVAAGASFDQRGKARTYNDPGVVNALSSDGTDIGAFELQPLCSLSCPSDISVSNDPAACGAIVNYTEPSDAACGTVTCNYPSGSFFPVGETTVTCTSSVGPTCSFKVTVNDTQDPTITAPAGFTVGTDSDSCVATGVSLGTPTTDDNCLVSPATNDAPGAFPLGPTTVTWTVVDNHGRTATATQLITVIDDTPPSLTVPADSSAFANSSCQAVIPDVVSGSAASDNCGSVTITQSPAAGTVVGIGAHAITVKATDAAGNQTDKTVTFTVTDNTSPTITLNGNVITLWSPDHTYANVRVSDLVASASDSCDAGVNLSSVYISRVASDEPENGSGDGTTFDDMLIAADCRSVQLRSERAGNGNGRVYTITFKVTDASGNVSTATAKVTVPNSQNGSLAVDDGPLYTVLSGCP